MSDPVSNAAKIDALTGIRGVAACWVMLLHGVHTLSASTDMIAYEALPVISSGYLAVDLFFVLSGFILAANYYPRFQSGGFGMLGAFATARFFRIMPLNIVALLSFTALVALLGPKYWTAEKLDAASFAASLLLIQSWGPFSPTAWNYPAWSLSAEWLAYFGFPLGLLVLYHLRGTRMALAGALMSLLLLAGIMLLVGGGNLEHVWRLGVVRCIFGFAAGMFLWRWWAYDSNRALRGDVLTVAALGTLGIAMLGPVFELLAPFAFAMMIVGCAQGGTVTNLLFAGRPVVFLGEISFSVYLFHAIIVGCFRAGGELLGWRAVSSGGSFVMLLCVVFGTILWASVGLYRWVELPGQALGRRLTARKLPEAGKVF